METPPLEMSSSPEPSAWMQAEHTADAVICVLVPPRPAENQEWLLDS